MRMRAGNNRSTPDSGPYTQDSTTCSVFVPLGASRAIPGEAPALAAHRARGAERPARAVLGPDSDVGLFGVEGDGGLEAHPGGLPNGFELLELGPGEHPPGAEPPPPPPTPVPRHPA